MTSQKLLDQIIFLMATLYGILQNEYLAEAMKNDVHASMDRELQHRHVVFIKCHEYFVKVFQMIVKFDQVIKKRAQAPYCKEFEETFPLCKERSLELLRLASRLITDLNKKFPREVYKWQIEGLMFLADKHQQYGTSNE